MKHIDLFNDFLKETVNLNDSRVTDLETSIGAIKDAVRESDWEPHRHGWREQGSWAHKTIIKPVDKGEFDADLLVLVKPVDGWSAGDYIEKLMAVFKANKTYKDMAKPWSHCVTITYANDKKIDVAPCLVNRGGYKRFEVCNRTTDVFEQSEPEQYTDWLIERNSYSGNNSFRKVTRLIKYLRDIKTRFTCSSVLLTTTLGYRICASDKNSSEFADTPTALKTIFGRMDDWLQINSIKPKVTNPFLQSENFADAWTDDQYSNFREKIHTYREWIDDAFNETDRDESIAKWRRVFGEDFAGGVVLEDGRSVSKNAVALLKSSVSAAALFTGDLVEAVRRYGASVVPARIYRLPYMDRPTWKRAASMTQVQVRAALYTSKNGSFIQPVTGLEALPPGCWLHFHASTSMGAPFNTNEFDIQWRVTNTDEVAYRANCLRGHFYASEKDNSRWEELQYRGVHLVEAFVIRKRDKTLVGQSPAFHVVIS
jgi:hypothetical protein